ncbi:MAG TPA: class I SAM-dependent methyltransferase [Pyrinomonadaceae bacterium]|nr:class I SAM-dependent methyltransferase [Pyrinomonadaceae bacterium]
MMSGENGKAAGGERAIQEAEYEFPYHYIPRLEGGNFSQVRKLRWGYEYLSYLRFILSRLEEVEFDSLLDVGCGEGRFLSEVSKRFPHKRLTGADVSARALEYARLLNPQVNFTCGDITDPSLCEGRFDVITLIETLEHISPPAVPDFVRGLRGYLKDDGRLIVSVPSENLSLNRKHYQHFNLASLSAALRPQFAVTEHYFLNRISRWDKLLGKLLDNRLFILNEPRLLNALYRRYERSLLNALESDGKRICVVCRPQ